MSKLKDRVAYLEWSVRSIEERMKDLTCEHKHAKFTSELTESHITGNTYNLRVKKCADCGRVFVRYHTEKDMKQAELAYLKKQVAELEEELCEKSQ